MQRQAVWHAVAQPDAVLDIQQTDMRGFRLAACGGAFQLLQPENPAYEPKLIPLSDFETGAARIVGVAVRLVREL